MKAPLFGFTMTGASVPLSPMYNVNNTRKVGILKTHLASYM